MATPAISLAGISGIVPKVSTLADVRRLLGDGLVAEQLPAHQTKNRLLPAKISLRHTTGVVAGVVDTCDELPPDAVVRVVGVEQRSPLCTLDGLRVGMPLADAEKVVSAGYRLLRRTPGCVELVAADGGGENFFGVYTEDGKVSFLGLYRREPGDF